VDFIEDGGSGAIQDSSAYDSLIGRTIANNFRLVKRIGAGAMGRVYQAEQLSLGKMVAIKVLRHELMADEKLVRRFELEARTASAVSHPNLIETFDCGRDPKLDVAYIAMELLPGPDLAQVIAREAPLDLARAARIMDQVLAALEEAHAQGIVHRDLKPGNIMLVPRRDDPEFVKVCDFGIAKIKTARARPNLTMAGLVFGTPEYMSPEQACGEDVDARTDLYAVAAILYQLVSGHLPFPAPSPTEVLARILRDEPERPSQRGYVTVPTAIENLILRGMSKDRASRPQTAAEFRVALREAWADIIESWSGHGSTAMPTLSLRPLASLPATPSTPVARRGPSAERPVVRGPSAERPVVVATPPTATPAVERPPSRIINWAVLKRRRPGKAATLGFTLTMLCGGLAIWALTTRHAPVPAHDAHAPQLAPPHPMVVATPPPSPTQGIIVVPSPPPAAKSAAGEERRAGVAKAPPVRREAPPRPHKPGARGKQAHHDERGSAVAASVGATHAASEAAEGRTDPGPVEAPPTEPAPANSLAARVAAAKSAPGVAHKLRATSIPSEAEVLIDGKLIGRTPLFGAEIDITQTHTLTIRKDGYAPYEQPVSVASAWVTRGSENVAALRVQTVLQKLDHAALAVETKTSSGPAAPVVASSSVALSASSHKLRITSIPTDAEVLIDGKSVGRTPLFGADIDMSRPHRVVLRKEGYALFEQNVTTSSDWVAKPSDRSSALLRISALLRRSDAALAQNPAAAAP
jgi:serine/threonine protein kinase